jgi:hypothetical protein
MKWLLIAICTVIVLILAVFMTAAIRVMIGKDRWSHSLPHGTTMGIRESTHAVLKSGNHTKTIACRRVRWWEKSTGRRDK